MTKNKTEFEKEKSLMFYILEHELTQSDLAKLTKLPSWEQMPILEDTAKFLKEKIGETVD